MTLSGSPVCGQLLPSLLRGSLSFDSLIRPRSLASAELLGGTESCLSPDLGGVSDTLPAPFSATSAPGVPIVDTSPCSEVPRRARGARSLFRRPFSFLLLGLAHFDEPVLTPRCSRPSEHAAEALRRALYLLFEFSLLKCDSFILSLSRCSLFVHTPCSWFPPVL